MTLPAAKQDQLQARVAGLVLNGTGWTAAERAGAMARLARQGLPGKRDEYWRYTDPASLTAGTAPSSISNPAADDFVAYAAIDRLKLVFVDGVFDAAQSDDPVLAGVEISLLSQSANTDLHWAKALYGVLEAQGQNPVARPLAALNTGFATEGVLIRVTAKAERPVALVYHHAAAASDVMLHHVIRVETGAELTLLESGAGASRLNTVVEVDVAGGARFHHVRVQGPQSDNRIATHMFARLGQGSLFKSFTLTVNGALTRNEAVIAMTGDDAFAHIGGAALGGPGFHQDDTVFITHGAERGESRQVFKKVLQGGAVGVFQGKILVKPGAQKTDGYQISQALLLDDDSQFLAKPELEIYADDVKCSHGSTSGAIDPDQLFYLTSRGVPKAAAQRLLVQAFLADALAEIEDEDIATAVGECLSQWFDRAGADVDHR